MTEHLDVLFQTLSNNWSTNTQAAAFNNQPTYMKGHPTGAGWIPVSDSGIATLLWKINLASVSRTERQDRQARNYWQSPESLFLPLCACIVEYASFALYLIEMFVYLCVSSTWL